MISEQPEGEPVEAQGNIVSDTEEENEYLRKAMNHELCLKLHFIFIRQQ